MNPPRSVGDRISARLAKMEGYAEKIQALCREIDQLMMDERLV